MRRLVVPDGIEFQGVSNALAVDDAMFDGNDDHYLAVGQSALRIVKHALRAKPTPRRILDLPCGHGRVTRVLRAQYPEAMITACDLDRSGVDFVAAQFNTTGVYSQEDFRALQLGDCFDLIWVGSLITHLPEQFTRRFFDFAARHLAPGGTLVVTSHGRCVAQRLLKWNYGLTDHAARGLLADSWRDGYGYRSYPGGETYGISLVRRAWYEDLFVSGPLRVDEYDEQGWDNHQDVLIIRPRAATHGKPPSPWVRFRIKRPPEVQAAVYGTGGCPPKPAAWQDEIDRQRVSGFDEDWYLAADPLVAEAVAEGTYTSGLDHYCKFGWREARPICDARHGYDAQRRLRGSTDEQAGAG